MNRLLWAINCCAAAATAILTLWLSGTGELDPFIVLVVAWTGLPYLLLALTPSIARRVVPGASPAPALVGSALLVLLAVVVLGSAFFADPDPQSPLVLLSLPVLQLLGAAAVFVVTVFTGWRRAA